MRRRLGLILAIAALVPAALAAAGCGDDDSSKSDSPAPGASAPSQAKDLPTDPGELKDACVDDLQKMGQSQDEAEKTCSVPDDADVDKAVEAALKGCLAVSKQLPSGSVRDQAEQDCRDSAK
jgi:hypothetical protein